MAKTGATALWGQMAGLDWRALESDQVLYVSHLARGICRNGVTQNGQPSAQRQTGQLATISSVEKIARSDPKHASTAEEWDADVWALNTQAAWLICAPGRMRPHHAMIG